MKDRRFEAHSETGLCKVEALKRMQDQPVGSDVVGSIHCSGMRRVD